MDAKLTQAMQSLRSAVDHDDMPAETRTELRRVVDAVEHALNAETHSHEEHGVDLHGAAARFEVDHPSLAENLRTVIHSLGSAGL